MRDSHLPIDVEVVRKYVRIIYKATPNYFDPIPWVINVWAMKIITQTAAEAKDNSKKELNRRNGTTQLSAAEYPFDSKTTSQLSVL